MLACTASEVKSFCYDFSGQRFDGVSNPFLFLERIVASAASA
jgi:hypothetical protein